MLTYAGIAQLVERCLAKAKVAGSSPVSRSRVLFKFPAKSSYTSDSLLSHTRNTHKHRRTNFVAHRLFVMKSIMEEASTLAKAFAQAWERAGKPHECTVKILAEPEKNFLGLTTKSAKIALFFTEQAPIQHKKSAPQQQKRTVQPAQQRPQPSRQPQQKQYPERSRQETRPIEHRNHEQHGTEQRSKPIKEVVRETSEVAPKEKPQPVKIRPTWSDEMTQGVRSWVQESLSIMGCAHVSFSITASRSLLTISFTHPIIEDSEKERLLFRSWAHLIVQHIKQEHKIHGKELKIILKGSHHQ